MGSKMKAADDLYQAYVGTTTALLAEVINRDMQEIKIKTLKVYWHELGHVPIVMDQCVEYLGLGNAWGRSFPEVGERIIVFIRHHDDSVRMFEHLHHVRVEQIDEQWSAIHLLMGPSLKNVPSWLENAARPYKETGVVYTPLNLFEQYLVQIATSP
jgi:hypothetical protein